MIFNFHCSVVFLFLVLTVWTSAVPTPRSYALEFQAEAREYNDQLDARRETGQLVRRKEYPEAREYYDELDARTLVEEEDSLLMGRTPSSLEIRGYSWESDELDARAMIEEGGQQLMSRKIHVPKWLKKIGGAIKKGFNKAKDFVKGMVSGGGGGGGQ